LPPNHSFLYLIGEGYKLKGKGIYFLRTTPHGKPINQQQGCDDTVLFGEISESTVTSLNTVINQVYRPLIGSLGTNDWGVCEEEQKKEFNQVFTKFAKELTDALKSLQNNLTLEPYDKKWDSEIQNNNNNK
jgi:hypothetical protein